MKPLAADCLHHPLRPAVARCPSCGRPFCRECVVEHEFRITCAECLEKIRTATDRIGRSSAAPLAAGLQLAAALLLMAFLFYLLGAVLLRIPAEIHEGMIWTE